MMKRVFAIAIATAFIAGPAHAATDCIGKYDSFWEKLSQYGNAKPTTEQVVGVNRQALRAYDACQSGDEANFADFWEKLNQYGNSKDDAKKFFSELSQYGNAK